MNINTSGFFKKEEILSTEKFYEYISRTKVIVFIPHNSVENVASEMFKAGAGIIGNYEMCSFRTEGSGTFKPNKNANPANGKKGFLSKVEEVKLEMECGRENVNAVINALLKSHPYEETAYELYDFRKRGEIAIGSVISLKSKKSISELFSNINKKISHKELNLKSTFKNIAVTNSFISDNIIESARFTKSECLLSISNKNHKLFIL